MAAIVNLYGPEVTSVSWSGYPKDQLYMLDYTNFQLPIQVKKKMKHAR